jgi:hypothetical protein
LGSPDKFFDGKIGKLRISDVTRSTAWIKASNESLNDNILSIQESNTTTTVSKTIHHNDINTWQKERTDITYLIGSGLLYLKSIAFNILNDDSDNTFYLDNMYLSNDNKN